MGRNYNYAKHMIIRTVQPLLTQHTNRWRRRTWRTLWGSMAARMGATIVVGSDCWREVATATRHWTIFLFLFSDLNLFPLLLFFSKWVNGSLSRWSGFMYCLFGLLDSGCSWRWTVAAMAARQSWHLVLLFVYLFSSLALVDVDWR